MAFAREIIVKILQNLEFRKPKEEKESYYTTINGTLVRVSNHCTRLYVWDNFLEQNPKYKGKPIVSIVFEDNRSTFNETECLTLKRNRPRPIKVNEYVFSLNGNAQYITSQDVKSIIGNMRRISNGIFVDLTNKSVPNERISRNPDDGASGGAMSNVNNINDIKTEQYMRQNKVRLTESKLRQIVRESVKRVLSESDTEYNEFIEKATNMERSDRFAFIIENTDNEQLLWMMWHWFENENNGKDMDDFMQHCLKQFAPKQDYWTQIRNIYNSPNIA